MTASTKGIRCAAAEWTLLADGKENVLVSMRNIGSGYLRTAAALPADTPSTDATPGDTEFDFITITNLKPAAFSFADTSTKVYFYPVGASAIDVEVVTE